MIKKIHANKQAKKLLNALRYGNDEKIEQMFNDPMMFIMDNDYKKQILIKAISTNELSYVQKALNFNPILSKDELKKVFETHLSNHRNSRKDNKKLEIFSFLFNQIFKKEFLENKMEYLVLTLANSINDNLFLISHEEINASFDIFKQLVGALNNDLNVNEKFILLETIVELPNNVKAPFLKEVLNFIDYPIETLLEIKSLAIKKEEQIDALLKNMKTKIIMQFPNDIEMFKQITIIEIIDMYIEKKQLDLLVKSNKDYQALKVKI